jgi:hypothetical protein
MPLPVSLTLTEHAKGLVPTGTLDSPLLGGIVEPPAPDRLPASEAFHAQDAT